MKVISASLFIFAFVMSGCGGIRVADEHGAGAPSSQAAVLSSTATAYGSVAQPTSTQATDDQTISTPTPEPTNAPAATPTQTSGQPTQPITGTWRQITTADGLCTDSPILIGRGFIGTLNGTFCYPTDGTNLREWRTLKIPTGERLVGMVRGSPDESGVLATSDGGCLWKPIDLAKSNDEWECKQSITDPNNFIVHIDDFHYRTATSVVIDNKTYDIADLVGKPDARPTWSESSNGDGHTNFQEVWVGTNGYGVIVIDREKGVVQRFTTLDGLPSDLIRDVNVATGGTKPSPCNIWIATDHGVASWDGVQWHSFTTANGLPSDDVRGVTSECTPPLVTGEWAVAVWAATAQGPAYFDGTTWHTFKQANGQPWPELTGVTQFAGNVLFATPGQGLIALRLGT